MTLAEQRRVIAEQVPEKAQIEAQLAALVALFPTHVRVEIVIETVDITALGDRKPYEVRGLTHMTTEVRTGFRSDQGSGFEQVKWEMVTDKLIATRVTVEEPT